MFDGSPAQAAGLSAHDVLVALDGLRATTENLDTLLSRYETGDAIEIVAFRGDVLMRFDVKLATQPPLKFSIEINPRSPRTARQLRRGWLGTARSAARRA